MIEILWYEAHAVVRVDGYELVLRLAALEALRKSLNAVNFTDDPDSPGTPLPRNRPPFYPRTEVKERTEVASPPIVDVAIDAPVSKG